MALNSNIHTLGAEEINFIPFKSNFVQVVGGDDSSSGFAPSGPSTYDFGEGIAVHNPYVRPFFNNTILNLPGNTSNIIFDFMTLDFKEFVSSTGTIGQGLSPNQILLSAFVVDLVIKNKSTSSFNRQYIKFRVFNKAQSDSFGPNYEFFLEILDQGKIIDSNQTNELNTQIQLQSSESDDPNVSLKLVLQHSVPVFLSNQQILTKGLITYTG